MTAMLHGGSSSSSPTRPASSPSRPHAPAHAHAHAPAHARRPPPLPLRASQFVTLPGVFYPVRGGELHDVTLKVECAGDVAAPRERTVIVFPSFSYGAHVTATDDDPSPGWWSEVVGPGLAIDTRALRVICVSPLGSPHSPTCPARARGVAAGGGGGGGVGAAGGGGGGAGSGGGDAPHAPPHASPYASHSASHSASHASPSSTSPASTAAAADAGGRPLRAAFPTLTPADLARAAAGALARVGVGVGPDAPRGARPLAALVGASLGGMQALQLASLFPGAARRVVTVAATGRTTPFSVALRHIQRAAILRDPDWRGGDYEDYGVVPARGLALARELGTTVYRSRAEFDARFAWAPRARGGEAAPGGRWSGGGGGGRDEPHDRAAAAGGKGGAGDAGGAGGALALSASTHAHAHHAHHAHAHHAHAAYNNGYAHAHYAPAYAPPPPPPHAPPPPPPPPAWTQLDSWDVESYLTYAGAKFVHAFDANAYLLLSYAMDAMDLGDGAAGRASFAEGAARVAAGGATRALLVGIAEDALIPAAESAALAAAINAAAPGAATFLELSSPLGHDAFLRAREVPGLCAALRDVLADDAGAGGAGAAAGGGGGGGGGGAAAHA